MTESPMSREDWLADMQAMRDEPIDPLLENWIEELEFGTCLRHPLVYQIPLTLPGMANRTYHQKLEALWEAEANGDWHTVVWLHERPYRTRALIDFLIGRDYYGNLTPLVLLDEDVRDLAADVWVDSENLEQYAVEWEQLLAHDSEHGLILASEAERAEFADLPDELTIYRGDIVDGGWSWSLDPKIAYFFANRFGANDDLVTGRVRKADVFGYLSRRGESELLVYRRDVRDVEPFAYNPEKAKTND